MKSLFFAFAVFSLLSQPASAGGSAAPPPESKSTITAVNLKTHEITIKYKTSSYNSARNLRTYTLDEISTITINHVRGKFEEIQVGMVVLGTTERDAHTLDNITLEVP